jgi:hypothetical protein
MILIPASALFKPGLRPMSGFGHLVMRMKSDCVAPPSLYGMVLIRVKAPVDAVIE